MNPKQRIHDKMVKLNELWDLVYENCNHANTIQIQYAIDSLMADLKLDLYILENQIHIQEEN